MKLKKECRYFPRIWGRYVDDVIAIIKKHHLRSFLTLLNSVHPNIKFTHETEENKQLAFLDLKLDRAENNIRYNIFRKSTTTDRFIPSDSHHCHSHKQAAFHAMIHRLVNIPLSPDYYREEENKIKQIARVNGYSSKMIDNLIKSHTRKKYLKYITTLQPIETQEKRFKIEFYPPISSKLKREFKKHNVQLIECSSTKLSTYTSLAKDKIDDVDKSGIYSIICEQCGARYIGQSCRAIHKRFSEHIKFKKSQQPSAVLQHMLDTDHKIDISQLHLLKPVTDNRRLDATESLFIQKHRNDNLLNNDDGPISSLLFHF